MTSWYDLCISSPSDNERIYDTKDMNVDASTSSTLTSDSVLGLWPLGDDFATQDDYSSQHEEKDHDYDDGYNYNYNYNHDYDGGYRYDSDSHDNSLAAWYTYWYSGRSDLSDDVIDELRNTLERTIRKTLPLSPEVTYAPLYLPQRSLQDVLEEQAAALHTHHAGSTEPTEPSSTSVSASREKAWSATSPQPHFQSKAFASLGTKRHVNTSSSQRQRQAPDRTSAFGNFKRDCSVTRKDVLHSTGSVGALSWRREKPSQSQTVYGKPQTRAQGNVHIRSNWKTNTNTNANTATSWRKNDPGTKWKWNEKTNGYTLMKL